MRISRSFCFLPLLLLTQIAFAATPAVTVGNPKTPERLASAVQAAYVGGARRIVIKPGVYLLPNVGHSQFNLKGWSGATISLYGATLILTDLTWGHNLFELDRCSQVMVLGGTLSQNKITSYQGRVVAVGISPNGSATCDWKPDASYPALPVGTKKFPGAANVVDSRTRRLKIGNGDFYDLPLEDLGDGSYRLSFNQKTLHFGPGDWLVGRYGDAPFKVSLDNCRDCTIQDVTMMRNGFSNIREDGGGGNHFLHDIWALGPRPGGATENPLVTNAADGLHSTGANPGPDIENCVFQGILLDDCLAVHGSFQTIQSVNGAVLIVKNGSANLKVGEPARLSDTKGFFGEAVVTALKDNGDQTSTVTLDKDLGVPIGAKLSNPQADGAGTKIIGCRLGNTRSRGILLKCDHAVVQNNVIEDCGMAAISLGPEYYWNEADYVQNVTLAGNTLRGNGGATYGGAAILIHGDGAMGNKNIVIKDNHFSSNLQGDLQIEWAEGVTLSGNTLTGAAPWPAMMDKKSPVSLSNCKTVTLRGNSVVNAGAYKPMLVEVGANVTGLQDQGETGIKAVIATSGTAAADQGSTVKVVVVDLKLKQLSFSGAGSHIVKNDLDGTSCNAPQWQDNSVVKSDGSVDDSKSLCYPLCYTRNTTASVSALLVTVPSVPVGSTLLTSGQFQYLDTDETKNIKEVQFFPLHP